MISDKSGDFGIVITCYRGDILLTKGLLASIKYFCGDIPVCLIADGDFSTRALQKTYNIDCVIRKEDVKNDFLRENCFGTRFTSLIAFSESPFERFLYMDSDIVLWGNILNNFNPASADFIHNEPHEPYTPFIRKSQYFDYDRIFAHTEYFDWENCNFFNSGIFVARRGLIAIEEIKELTEIWKTNKKLLPTEPQGALNIAVFRNLHKGKITVNESSLQTIIPMFSKEQLSTQYFIDKGKPVVNKPTVLHWAGYKPLYRQDAIFNAPMNFFRTLNLKYRGSLWQYIPGLYFRIEELVTIYHQYYRKNPGKIIRRILKKNKC